MKANYHTHTVRCNHAVGEEREYIEAAVQSGLNVLGFSDHTPQPYPNKNYFQNRMGMEQLEDYVTTILKLKAEYQSDIEIYLGLEVEYYPAFFEQLMKTINQYPFEYLLLAQHTLGNGELWERYGGTRADADNPARLKRYCDQVIEGMEMGCFTYLAHPDLICFTGDIKIYDTQIRRLCRKAKVLRIPLEINFLGLSENRNYPREDFWKIAGEEDCDVVFGVDAHSPEAFSYDETLEKAQMLVEKYHLRLLERVMLRKPGEGK